MLQQLGEGKHAVMPQLPIQGQMHMLCLHQARICLQADVMQQDRSYCLFQAAMPHGRAYAESADSGLWLLRIAKRKQAHRDRSASHMKAWLASLE